MRLKQPEQTMRTNDHYEETELRVLIQTEEARAEFERAASLTRNARERELLRRRAAETAPTVNVAVVTSSVSFAQRTAHLPDRSRLSASESSRRSAVSRRRIHHLRGS